jgi:hypothetical protein
LDRPVHPQRRGYRIRVEGLVRVRDKKCSALAVRTLLGPSSDNLLERSPMIIDTCDMRRILTRAGKMAMVPQARLAAEQPPSPTHRSFSVSRTLITSRAAPALDKRSSG